MVARILLYIILLLIIPAALYFLFTSDLFVTLPFSRQKIQEERQEQVYKTALTKEYLSTKEEISNLFEEAKKFKYKFTEGSGLVLVDIMRLLWPEEKDLRYGIRLTPMAKPTEWIFPNQTNTEAIIIHHTFAWRIAAVMEGDEESIKQEILGTDVSEVGSKIGDRGQAIYLRAELERIMGSKTVEEIIPDAGKQQLKQQLLEKLRAVFGDKKVKSVYIDTLIFQ